MFRTNEWRTTRILSGCRPRAGETGVNGGVAIRPHPDGVAIRAACPSGRYRVEAVVRGVGDLPEAVVPYEIIQATLGSDEINIRVDRSAEIRVGDTVYTSPLSSGGVPRPDHPGQWVEGPGSEITAALDLGRAGDADRDQTPFRHIVIGRLHSVAGSSGGRIVVLGPTVPWLYDAFGVVRLPLDRVAWLRGVVTSAQRFSASSSYILAEGPGFVAQIPIWAEPTPLDSFAATGLDAVLEKLPQTAEVSTAELARALSSDATTRITSAETLVVETVGSRDELDSIGSAGFSTVVSTDKLKTAVGLLRDERVVIRGTAAAVILQSGSRTAFLLAQRA